MSDLLDPGGVFANLDPVASPTERAHAAFFAAIDVPLENADPSDRLLDVGTQVQWLRDLGFTDVDCKGVGFRSLQESMDTSEFGRAHPRS